MSDSGLKKLGRIFLRGAIVSGVLTVVSLYNCLLGCRAPDPLEGAINSVAEALHLPGIWDYSFLIVVFFYITAIFITGALVILIIETYRRIKNR